MKWLPLLAFQLFLSIKGFVIYQRKRQIRFEAFSNENLDDAVENLYKLPKDTNTPTPLPNTNPYDLQELREQLQQVVDASAADTNNTLATSVDDDGVYLDPNEYVNLMLDSDGSMNLKEGGSGNHPFMTTNEHNPGLVGLWVESLSPDYSPGEAEVEPSEQDLWDAAKDMQGRAANVSADLHQQIFEEEQAFLEQSKEFRASLLDGSKTLEAEALRHGQEYRQRQKDAIEKLNQELDQFQQELAQCQTDKNHPRCTKCYSRLDPVELAAAKNYKGLCQVCRAEELVKATEETANSQALRSSRTLMAQPVVKARDSRGSKWKLVKDQVTGDVFYWNEETEEMQWEKPSD